MLNDIAIRTCKLFHILMSLKSEYVLQPMPVVIGGDFIFSLLVAHKIMGHLTTDGVLEFIKF